MNQTDVKYSIHQILEKTRFGYCITCFDHHTIISIGNKEMEGWLLIILIDTVHIDPVDVIRMSLVSFTNSIFRHFLVLEFLLYHVRNYRSRLSHYSTKPITVILIIKTVCIDICAHISYINEWMDDYLLYDMKYILYEMLIGIVSFCDLYGLVTWVLNDVEGIAAVWYVNLHAVKFNL